MTAAATAKTIEVDTDDAIALFAGMFGRGRTDEPGLGVRIRYLQRTPFPQDRPAGRGKRTTHDLTAVLKLTTALALMDLGVSTARASVATNAFWNLFEATLLDAWRDISDVNERRVRRARMILVEVNDLTGSSDALVIGAATVDQVVKLIADAGSASGGWLLLNPWALVSSLRTGLVDTLRYRDDEIASGFEALAG